MDNVLFVENNQLKARKASFESSTTQEMYSAFFSQTLREPALLVSQSLWLWPDALRYMFGGVYIGPCMSWISHTWLIKPDVLCQI